MKCLLSFSLSILLSIGSVAADDLVTTLWELNSLDAIGGNTLTVLGNPEVVSSDKGDVIKFDGNGDRLLVDNNPIGDSKAYTLEAIFKPDAGALNRKNEPRFVHIQDPNDSQSKRITLELRVDANDKMYIDGFMLTDKSNLTLIDATKTHNTEEWVHAAITFDGSIFSTYVNGVKELSGAVSYSSKILNTIGKTSIGGRQNNKNYFSGLIKCLRITQAKLDPSQFMTVAGDDPLALVNNFDVDDVTIYPMPVRTNFTIKFKQPKQIRRVELISMYGCVVKSVVVNDLESQSVSIDVSDLSIGVYLIKIWSAGGAIVRRIIVE